jgi:tetratricopeptide (TPR) repeat protein
MGGDPERAVLLFERSLELRRSLGDEYGIASACYNLGVIAQKQGRLEDAVSLFCGSLGRSLKLGDEVSVLQTFASLAAVFVSLGDLSKAAGILSAIAGIASAHGQYLPPADQPDYDRTLAQVRSELNPHDFAAAWDEGRTLSLEEAVYYATGPSDLKETT